MPQRGALVIYGRGADLGNFKFFADDLITTELASYGKENTSIKNIERRDAFFDLLLKPPLIIRELHIYSHSIGGGLYLGYKDPALSNERGLVAATTKPGSYLTVLNTEKGAVLTDDLVRQPYLGYREKIRANFDSNAKIKIWGCNSGITNWTYGDPTASGGSTADPNVAANYYYWRALNELNVPKPSIAQAFADYFRVPTYGAGSGSSIEVKYKGEWVSSTSFLKATRRRFVNEADVLRLAPDKGVYNEYKPR